MLRKTCALADFKMIEEGPGGFSGYGSTFGTRDLAGEIVARGAFDGSLDRFKSEGFIAVGHSWTDLPVATVADAYEDHKGLFVRGDFHTTDEAQKARTYVRERLERKKSVGLSIGYSVKQSEPTKDGLLLKELDLFEVSIVTVPCNPEANATSVKEAKAQYLGDYCEGDVTCAALERLSSALFYHALYPILYEGEGTVEERMTRADGAFSEFHEKGMTILRALAAVSDEGEKAERAAEFKQVFSLPERASGSYREQISQVRATAERLTRRGHEINDLRKGEGRLLGQETVAELAALNEAITGLVEAATPPPEPAGLDLDLLRLKVSARKRRTRWLVGVE